MTTAQSGISLLISATPLAAGEPAGGAALDQVIVANLAAIAASAALGWLVLGHRSGRVPYLGRAAAAAERASGLPGWAALPSAIASASLLIALIGMYWDIALHIDVGRDAGPLANPAHYLILAGLFGIFCAGFVAMALPLQRPGPTAIRINRGWYAPLGGVLIVACAFFSLLGFPLDDLWHRLFGQDVTLWGPTHLMLIGGAAMTLVGQAVLLVEGMRAMPPERRRATPRLIVRLRRVGLMGGLLIGLSAFQGEFDFGVPQFQLILQPALIALAAGVALVCARLWVGRGGALGTVAFFLAIRGALALLVGPGLGETLPHFPLYVVEAACVEVVALALARRPLALATVSGLLIGTVGFAAEYGFGQLAMPLPWSQAMLPAGPIVATIAGVAGGLLGAMTALALRGELPRPALARAVPVVALTALAAVLAYGLHTTSPRGIEASIEARALSGADQRVSVSVRLDPSAAAEDAKWLTITAWQGGGLVVDRLERGGEGAYHTSEPIPVGGDWKTMLRLHEGNVIAALPVYLPADPSIPAAGVPVRARFTAPLLSDRSILQRETKRDVPAWLETIAPLTVLAIALCLVLVLCLGLGRIGRGGPRRLPQRPRWQTAGMDDAARSPEVRA